jgi:hypothetical protein
MSCVVNGLLARPYSLLAVLTRKWQFLSKVSIFINVKGCVMLAEKCSEAACMGAENVFIQ